MDTFKNELNNNNRAELSSTTDPHDSTKKNGQNNQLKIYNIMYNNFSYEQDVLQKNLKDFDMDKSTPSLLSEQSFSNTNYCNFFNFFKNWLILTSKFLLIK